MASPPSSSSTPAAPLRHRFCLLTLLLLLLFSLSGCSITHALRVENREVISVDQMIQELVPARVVLVGESHDVAAHHRLQLEVIKGLRKEGKPVAIGMEMFEGKSQPMLDAWVAGKVSEPEFIRLYQNDWRNIPWSLYREILLYARDSRILVIALNAPRQLVEKVSHKGFASLSPEEQASLPESSTDPVPDSFLKFIGSAYPMHGKNFQFLCEAQILRNRVMAYRITEFVNREPETTLVALAGGGHVREQGGVPSLLKKTPFKVVLSAIPGLTEDEVTPADGDYLLVEPFRTALF